MAQAFFKEAPAHWREGFVKHRPERALALAPVKPVKNFQIAFRDVVNNQVFAQIERLERLEVGKVFTLDLSGIKDERAANLDQFALGRQAQGSQFRNILRLENAFASKFRVESAAFRLAHGGNPILRWMMDNIYIRTDPAGNIKADKEKSTEKIDGAVATIMALDRAIRCGNDTGESVYDKRGLLIW